MDAVAEGEVRSGRSVDVEDLRVRVGRGIVVGRGEADQDLLAAGDLGVVQREGLGRPPECGVGDRGRVAQELLHGGRHPVQVGPQRFELVGVVEQGDDGVADVGRRGVVAGDDQLEEARQQLLVVQPVVVAGRDEDAHQVVPG